MADLQHSSIPDEHLHEVKHALGAQENTFLRSKGDGTTEFSQLTLASFTTPVLVRDDASPVNAFAFTPKLGKQYLFLLRKQTGSGLTAKTNYETDILDMRTLTFVPTGDIYLESVGGKVRFQSGQFQCVDADQAFLRVTEVQ